MPKVTQTYNLGQQMLAASEFRQVTRQGAIDYTAALTCWNELRQNILPRHGFQSGHFGAFPSVRNEKKLPAFADRVIGGLSGQLSMRIRTLADKGVNPIVCRYEGISPRGLLKDAAAGLVSQQAVTAFNVSAAKYLSEQLSTYRVKLGDLIEEGNKLMHLMPSEFVAKMRGASWDRNLNALGVDPAEMRMQKDETPVGYQLRVVPLVGLHIAEALRLLTLYGLYPPSTIQADHAITPARMQQAMQDGIIMDEAVFAIWNAHAACIHRQTRYRGRLRAWGITGLVGTAIAGGFYLFPKGWRYDVAVDRLMTPSFTLLFFGIAALAFGIMAFQPQWFVDE